VLRRSLLVASLLLLTGCASGPVAHCSATGYEAPPLLDPVAAVFTIGVDVCEGIVRAHRAITAPAPSPSR
jgi:hypothetical protein